MTSADIKKPQQPPDHPAQLISQCIQGDDAAKAQFYLEYSTLIRNAVNWSLNKLSKPDRAAFDAQDVTQEVFVRLFSNDCRALARLRRPQSINAWLITIVHNYVRTIQRKHTVRKNTLLNAVRAQEERYVTTHATKIAEQEEHTILRARIAALSPQDRLVIELYFIQDLKYSEIASVLRLNVNTVSARLRRAKAKLRGLIEGDLK